MDIYSHNETEAGFFILVKYINKSEMDYCKRKKCVGCGLSNVFCLVGG